MTKRALRYDITVIVLDNFQDQSCIFKYFDLTGVLSITAMVNSRFISS